MRLNISAWAIRRPIPPIVLFVVLFLMGLYGFRALPITQFPALDFPLVTITVTQPGAAPSEILNQVTKKVEDGVANLSGVKHITTSISDGVMTTMVEFTIGTDTDRALNDVKDAVTKIRADLPGDIDEPLIQRLELESLPILTYAVSAPAMTPEEEAWFVDDIVVRQLKTISGVGEVTRVGGADREIRVTLDPDRLLALGVTAGDVTRQLRVMNIDLPGGRGEVGGQEQAIRALGGAQSVRDLAATSIVLPGGRKVRLDALANVTDGAEEPRVFARLDGKPVVAFMVKRTKEASDVTVGDAVMAKIADLEKNHSGVTFQIIENEVTYTLGAFRSTMHTLMEGAALSVLVVFLFLRDWRATVIASVALPLSIIPTFWIIHEMGFSLNLISLLAITLVTGILVDDAIVEIENIVRHMRLGKSPYRAALEAADEIGLAVIAITFTIVAVFVPVAFMPGIAGQYFRQFGLTVAVAVLISLLVARLLTPMLAAFFLRDHGHEAETPGRIMQAYLRVVRWAATHKYKTFCVGIVLFILSAASTMLIPMEFIPKEDNGRSHVVIELPPGSRLEDTRAVTDAVTARLEKMPEVKSVFTVGGLQVPNRQEIRLATLFINYVDKSERSTTQMEMEKRIGTMLNDIPDVRGFVLDPNGQREVQVIVSGGSEEEQIAAGAALEQDMRRMPTVRNVISTVPLNRPEIRVRPKPALAAELGVTTAEIAETIRVATIGDVSVNLPKFNTGERQIPIRVQLPESSRSDLHLIETLKVRTGSGATVPLIGVVDFDLGKGPSSIDRYDRSLKVAIEADLNGSAPLGQVLGDIRETPAAKAFPKGVVLREGGDAEAMVEVFSGFIMAMVAGIMLMLGVLILLFSNFLQPFTILLSLPLSIGGAILGLFAARQSISLPVFIGFLMLMGIVAKNAIMLVDFGIEAMARGVGPMEAIIDAGRKRSRPIVMTTMAMTAGMLPSAFGFGDGGDFRSPMAIAVIGGLLASTCLSLIFVPAFFMIINDLSRLSVRVFGRFIGERDEPENKVDKMA